MESIIFSYYYDYCDIHIILLIILVANLQNPKTKRKINYLNPQLYAQSTTGIFVEYIAKNQTCAFLVTIQ